MLALAALAAGLACATPSVNVTLADPQGLRAGATYAEFLMFDGGCPSQDDLIAGDYPEPLVDQRLDVEDEFGALGTLDAKRYGFAAVLRTDDCGVLGAGCSEADLSERIDSVLIPLRDVFPRQGACPGECSEGLCE
ncbi:MAG TPA: hypothetical protein VFS43_06490 [Polyangiaceae bacterium]|nr:hypothetical protein [Polyangiaceae bacterium]